MYFHRSHLKYQDYRRLQQALGVRWHRADQLVLEFLAVLAVQVHHGVRRGRGGLGCLVVPFHRVLLEFL